LVNVYEVAGGDEALHRRLELHAPVDAAQPEQRAVLELMQRAGEALANQRRGVDEVDLVAGEAEQLLSCRSAIARACDWRSISACAADNAARTSSRAALVIVSSCTAVLRARRSSA
jgi:hypothetical protein